MVKIQLFYAATFLISNLNLKFQISDKCEEIKSLPLQKIILQ